MKKDTNDKKDKAKYFIPFIIIVILIVIILLLLYLVRKRVTITGQAYGTQSKVEMANSYLFASPLKAKAGSSERIRITVFLLDSQGKGVFGKTVILGENDEVRTVPVQTVTDSIGKAMFDVSSSKAGYFLLEASVDGKIIPQRVGITFQ